MRAVTQVLLLPGEPHDRLLIVDEDGWMWWTPLDDGGLPSHEPHWEAVRAPGDIPPFMDMRDRLTRLEDSLRATGEENRRLLERLDELPAIDDAGDAGNET